jgi:hypothetical protein
LCSFIFCSGSTWVKYNSSLNAAPTMRDL